MKILHLQIPVDDKSIAKISPEVVANFVGMMTKYVTEDYKVMASPFNIEILDVERGLKIEESQIKDMNIPDDIVTSITDLGIKINKIEDETNGK